MDNNTFNVVYGYFKRLYSHSCHQFNKQMLLAAVLICTSILIVVLNISYVINGSLNLSNANTSLGILYFYSNINNGWYNIANILLYTGMLAGIIYIYLSSEVIFKHDDIIYVMPRLLVIDALSKIRIKLTFTPYFYLLILPNIILNALLLLAEVFILAVTSYKDAIAFDVVAGFQDYQAPVSERMIDCFVDYSMHGAYFYNSISWTCIIVMIITLMYIIYVVTQKYKTICLLISILIIICSIYIKELLYDKYIVRCIQMPTNIVYVHYSIYLVLFILSLIIVKRVSILLHRWALIKDATI
jgi:hypothetical protein